METPVIAKPLRPLFQVLAGLIQARNYCNEKGLSDRSYIHEDRIQAIVDNEFPSGSGFDSGTTLDLDKSTPEKLVFHTAFHHMNPVGYYDGWTHHTVTVRPSLAYGFTLSVSGRNRRDIKEYIVQAFHEALNRPDRMRTAEPEYSCLSVLGGWITQCNDGSTLGPVFNSVNDLWNWQRDNLPKA